MPTEKLITSGQVVRIGDLASIPLRTAIVDVLKKLGVTSNEAQSKIIANGRGFQDRLQESLWLTVESVIAQMLGRKHPAAADIEKYLHDVFGFDVDLTGVVFPQVATAPCYMLSADCIPLSTQQMWEKLLAWAKPQNKFVYDKLSTAVPVAQPLKIFAHVGGDEPDTVHLNKSYNDAKDQNIDFLDVRDYILINGFHFWKYRKWMDIIGWTRLDSGWSGGDFVRGCFPPKRGMLCLFDGNRGVRDPLAGPRERFWVS